ncbi:MAG: hypothetical protein AMS20_02000 [Gemmatimonas sp. SG8_28]|nr:MAG: hypothetical protein AMS20_02000 [Gemmatimonas sp. SG8_28]
MPLHGLPLDRRRYDAPSAELLEETAERTDGGITSGLCQMQQHALQRLAIRLSAGDHCSS